MSNNARTNSISGKQGGAAISINLTIAVIIPCFNEEKTIANVIHDIRKALPTSKIYVYDNNSDDKTVAIAKYEGAIIKHEKMQGKGNVIRRAFSDVEADIYLIVDGDSTYDVSVADKMIEILVENDLDMVVGTRLTKHEGNAFRGPHKFGNHMITLAATLIFGKRFSDMLSGLRVFSRRYVKSFPALAKGFETETELTIHAMDLNMPIAEIETYYYERPEGSSSKLNTYKDGIKIIAMILMLFKEYKPAWFFGIFTTFFVTSSLAAGYPVISEYMETGLVPRFPTAILATGLMILGFIFLLCGLILDSVARQRREHKRLVYLSIPYMQNK